MNPATIAAFFLGLLRLAAMGMAFYLYKDAHGDAVTLAAAGGLGFFAMTGQAFDVLKVQKQVSDAQTTTSVTVQQPANAADPVVLSPMKVAAAPVAPKGDTP